MKHILCFAVLLITQQLIAQTQHTITATVFDTITKESLQGVVITDVHQHKTTTDANGKFSIATTGTKLNISFVNYQTKTVEFSSATPVFIALHPVANNLDQVIVSANKTTEKRSEAPVAISVINKQTIEDTKASRIDQLLNKVSGVFMVNLGNEQHQMSIRQPMTTKSVFLYLEDGIPIRTTGVYNHNALLEVNMTAAKSIEVIKGPASALYGAEAIAGAVNIITQSSPAVTSGNISAQINNNGYKRMDAQVGLPLGKWGIIASGYYAQRSNGPIDFSDFHKTSITVRTDYKATEKTTWSNTFAYVDYYSDMTGALDSAKFAQRNYSTPHTFTFRSVNALRVKSMLTQKWNSNSESNVSFMYRNNSVKQNPSYSVASTANPVLYKGQVNNNSFTTYALFLQHTQKFSFLKTKLVAGASLDVSPQTYNARFIWINKDASSGKYTSYASPNPDSLLNNYRTGISNIASYIDYEISPAKGLRIVAALRYDVFRYNFENYLPPTVNASSGITNFSRFTPKLGLTYNKKNIGFYANYSEGYVPPQITELFNSTKMPYLLPQTFYNYEVGGWLNLLQNKLYADWSLYLMNGSNEIISVKQPDNSNINQNTGKTKHAGIEYGITYKPTAEWMLRISATNAKHEFTENIVKGIDYSGKEMSGAPRFTTNAEVMYKPKYIKGLRVGIEWQHQGAYFMDDLDQYKYDGFDVVNIRAGYQLKGVEVWVNTLNIGNRYYSTFVSKSANSGSASYSYNLGDPREITIGVGWKFGK